MMGQSQVLSANGELKERQYRCFSSGNTKFDENPIMTPLINSRKNAENRIINDGSIQAHEIIIG